MCIFKVIKMFKHIFKDTFDFNRDGRMDNFEKRAVYTAFLDEVRRMEGIEKSLSDMSAEELNELAVKSGVDPSGFGF